MNIALFSTILVLLLIFSIIFAVLLFLALAEKFSKHRNNISKSSSTNNTNPDFNLDSLKDLFSFFQSSSGAKKVFTVDDAQQDQLNNSSGGLDSSRNERYVSLNPTRRPLHLNLTDLVDGDGSNMADTIGNPSKFLDYDQTEYFSLKRKKQQQQQQQQHQQKQLPNFSNDLIKLESGSSSSSSPKSTTGTTSSSVSMTKSTFINNDDSTTVSSIVGKTNSIASSSASNETAATNSLQRHLCSFDNSVNKYYL